MASVNETDKLRMLLPHWIEHNKKHADEFRRWAEKAGSAQSDILDAADRLEAATDILARALDELGGPLEDHGHHGHHHSHR